MNARKRRDVPAELERTRQRFERWRRSGKARRRIPDSLWAAAVKMAGRYGVCQTAQALRLGYYSLKRRLDDEGADSAEMPQTGRAARFLELPVSAPTGRGQCIVELEDPAGAKMRIRLEGFEAPDLAALSRTFWRLDR